MTLKKDYIGNFLFGGRWVLAVFYIGLQIGLLLYAIRFATLLWKDIVCVNTSTGDEFMLSILELVDIAMIANLVDMIKSGSYTIFVRRFRFNSSDDRPQWLDHMSTGLQKVKMAASILGISSIHLLKSFVNAANEDWIVVQHQMWLHGMFIIGLVALAITDWIGQYKTEHKAETHEELAQKQQETNETHH